MSGASAHKSRMQRQARRLATDLAKGRMPASTVDLEDYLDRFPDDVFVALDSFVEQVASSGAGDAIALGYLYLIQGQLERIRFRSERGYEDAVRLIEEFQRAVADLAITGRIEAQALSMVTSVLHMAGIEASAELHAGVTQFAENVRLLLYRLILPMRWRIWSRNARATHSTWRERWPKRGMQFRRRRAF